MEKYHGSHLTNCSSFANFLATGEFVECKEETNLAVVTQGMRPYHLASSVDVGDVVMIAYAWEQIFKSRHNDFRRKFLRAKKQHVRNGNFTDMVPMIPSSKTHEQILDLCMSSGLDGYHFMVCIGKENGKPLWLFQNGYQLPGEKQRNFGMSMGESNPYPHKVPLFACIKKRR